MMHENHMLKHQALFINFKTPVHMVHVNYESNGMYCKNAQQKYRFEVQSYLKNWKIQKLFHRKSKKKNIQIT